MSFFHFVSVWDVSLLTVQSDVRCTHPVVCQAWPWWPSHALEPADVSTGISWYSVASPRFSTTRPCPRCGCSLFTAGKVCEQRGACSAVVTASMTQHSPPQLGLEVVTLLAQLVIIACEGILHHTVLVRSRVPWARARLCTPPHCPLVMTVYITSVNVYTMGGIVSIYSYSKGGSQVGYYKQCDSLIGDEEVLRRRWIWCRRQTSVWWPASRASSFPEDVRCTTIQRAGCAPYGREFQKRSLISFPVSSPSAVPLLHELQFVSSTVYCLLTVLLLVLHGSYMVSVCNCITYLVALLFNLFISFLQYVPWRLQFTRVYDKCSVRLSGSPGV